MASTINPTPGQPEQQENPIQKLRSLPSIRERCTRVHQLAREGKLEYFTFDEGKRREAVEYCAGIINRDFGTNYASIPPHGRWRHFDIDHSRVELLQAKLLIPNKVNAPVPTKKEQVASLLDLFLVSVLLDAGAGNDWKYTEKATGKVYQRSEGLAIASLDMFAEGLFSSVEGEPYRVDAQGLQKVTLERMATAMQVTTSNPMTGLEGRTSLLTNLSAALSSGPTYFGKDARPGNLLNFLESHTTTYVEKGITKVHINALWKVLIEGLAPIWPTDRTALRGVPLGDVWPCDALAKATPTHTADNGDGFVPFHKLSQWLAYSLVEPIEKILGWEFEGMENMTGLPEYRNGGLLVDLGVLSIKPNAIDKKYFPYPAGHALQNTPRLPPSHPAIIEWRAMTVIELDLIAQGLRERLNYNFTLPQVLESATWKGGRQIAKDKKRLGGGPPIEIESDGTVF